jgi:adenylate cyclase
MDRLKILRHPMLASLILAAVVCALVAGLVWLGALATAELQGYDLLVAVRGPQSPPTTVTIVDFDDATMDDLKIFPIPRAILGRVVEKISSGEPALIGLDILLSEKRAAEDDQQLTQAITKAGNVIIANNFRSAQLPPSEPLPIFRDAALDVAFVNAPLDEDARVRRVLLWMKTPEFSGVSLPVALVSNFTDKPLEPGRPGTVRIGATEISLDGVSPNATLIAFRKPTAAQIISVQRLLAEGFDPSVFKGKIVLVGQSSAKGKDLFLTPVNRFGASEGDRALLSGAEIHAAAIATLLSGDASSVLRPLPLWLLNFLLAWLALAAVISARPAYAALAALGAILGAYALAQFLFSTQHVWIRFISSEAGILFALPAGFGYRFLVEQRLKSHAEAERKELMGLFGRYVSPEVAREIWERREEIVLSGQERTATVLFSDIRNFTAMTAEKPSADVLAWLNEYFTAMSKIIQEHGGFLNKFIGDGMLVVFGVPLSDGVENDACQAVQAAIEMVQRARALNLRLGDGHPKIEIGVGIHTGPLTAGNVGARDRLEYSVIGETVNLASRLEALTKEFKSPIVLSPQTHEFVRGRMQTSALGEAAVRGFSGKIRVYTVGEPSPRVDHT